MHPLGAHQFEIPLASRRRRGLFLTLAALVALGGSIEAAKVAAVTELASSSSVTTLEKALAIDPANAALHSQLAALDRDAQGATNPAAVVAEARRAAALDPYNAGYWLDLAAACESAGDPACAGQATAQALELSPQVPRVWWTAGNYYVRAGRPASALDCFHRLLRLSPDYAAPAFALTLRAYGDPATILESIVGGDTGLELAYADFMSAANRFDAAHDAWKQLASARARFPFPTVAPYLERLLAHGRYEEAEAVWSYLESRRLIERPADSLPGDLIFNGSFEQAPLQAGFDWRAQPSPYVAVDFTDPSAYAGARALRVDFPVAENDEFEPAYQTVLAAPHRAYTLAAYVKSSAITSDSGPRLRVIDPACPGCVDAVSEATVGTTPWHAVTLQFTTGPATQALRVSVWRPRSRVFPMEIAGSFWLDAVTLRPAR